MNKQKLIIEIEKLISENLDKAEQVDTIDFASYKFYMGQVSAYRTIKEILLKDD